MINPILEQEQGKEQEQGQEQEQEQAVSSKLEKKINIAICGQVSSGKSTAINAIIGKYISETSMTRTTRSVYTFTPPVDASNCCTTIREDIERHNQSDIISKVEFVTPIPFVSNESFVCSLRDYPGFNDGKEDIEGMEKIFYSHLPELDYVIYIIDATCPLLHKSEKDLIINIFDKIKENHTKNKYTRIAFIFNKLDDEEDTEILEMIHEAKIWLFDQMSTRCIDAVDNWFLSVSFRKMMIYSVHASNNGKLTDIPEIILRRTLTDMYGKAKAKNIIDNKSGFELDPLSDDERHVFSILKGFVDKKFNIEYMAKKYNDKLNSIPYTEYKDIIACMENHRYLNSVHLGDVIVSAYLEKMGNLDELYGVEWICHTNIMQAIYKEYINALNFDNFVKDIYHRRISLISQIDSEDTYKEYVYILSKFIELGIRDWLNDDIINCFDKKYSLNELVIRKQNITISKGKYTVYTEKALNNVFDINNMKKISETNSYEAVRKLVYKLDIVMCQKLFGEAMMEDKHIHIKTLYRQSSEYNYEKQYSTCARMEKNWIDFKGVECGVRINKYNNIKEYHEWSSKYAGLNSEIRDDVIGLYPQHVLNYILLSKK